MARLPQTAESVVRDFAASMGLAARESADGSYSFRFAGGDLLTFTPAADAGRLLVSITFQPDRPGDAVEAKAIAAAGLDTTADRFIHVGQARDGSVVIAVALAAAGLDLPTVDRTLLDLRSLRAAIA